MFRILFRPLTFSLFISVFIIFSFIPLAQAEQSSIDALQTRSANGDKESQNLLGVKYFLGDGVLQNDLKAAELFTRAARQGLSKAQFNLGYMYHQGIGIPRNYVRACVWYKAAADQGHFEAQESYDSLKPYLNDEKHKRIAELSSQIPAHVVAAENSSSSVSSDPAMLEDWLHSVSPAAGK